jgi:hypothetical protein
MTEFHYYYEDALAAAEAFAAENNGFIANDEATFDDRHRFYYADTKANNLCWSGEVSAIIVRDNDSYEDVAYFASWTSKSLE